MDFPTFHGILFISWNFTYYMEFHPFHGISSISWNLNHFMNFESISWNFTNFMDFPPFYGFSSISQNFIHLRFSSTIFLPFRYVDVQPKLRPNHWRLLDSDAKTSNNDGSASLFLSSAMIRHLDSHPLPSKNRNASTSYYESSFDEVLLTSPDSTKRGKKRRQRRVKREDISAALSKNITMILEDLLKDYDKTERPAFKQGQATKVKINILIRSMGPISEEDMNYSMDCYFRQYWRDERLGFTGLKKNTHKLSIDQLSLNVKMLEKIWKPDTYFHNGLSSYLHTITRPNKLLRISEHGDITYSMRYQDTNNPPYTNTLNTVSKNPYKCLILWKSELSLFQEITRCLLSQISHATSFTILTILSFLIQQKIHVKKFRDSILVHFLIHELLFFLNFSL